MDEPRYRDLIGRREKEIMAKLLAAHWATTLTGEQATVGIAAIAELRGLLRDLERDATREARPADTQRVGGSHAA